MKRKMFAGGDANLFERAKALRKSQTHAEEVLWNYLKQKPMGYKFRRQHPLGNFILDFYCHSLQLVIEVDGPIHNTQEVAENDRLRETVLQNLGLTIIRFTNQKIEQSLEVVIQTIHQHLQPNLKPQQNKATTT